MIVPKVYQLELFALHVQIKNTNWAKHLSSSIENISCFTSSQTPTTVITSP